jgi:hypothetical protein
MPAPMSGSAATPFAGAVDVTGAEGNEQQPRYGCLCRVTCAWSRPLTQPLISVPAAFTVKVPDDGWDSVTWLPETDPMTIAEGCRTALPPPMTRKFPETLRACPWRRPRI